MKEDIDRLDMDGIATFRAATDRGRSWMRREYPTKYNSLNQVVLFRIPSQAHDMEDFVQKAAKIGLVIRTLREV